jgi:DNA-binding NtrC family response regulator
MTEGLKGDVLLVDDEEQFLNVLAKRLEKRGFTVETAESGEKAIDKVKSRDFDTVILDLFMPGMDGMETLKRIREENPNLSIIILSGQATIEKSVEVMKMGASDLLEKPVDLNKLLEKIAETRRKKGSSEKNPQGRNHFIGSHILKVVPSPTLLLTSILPLISSMSSFTMARPMPAPESDAFFPL